MQTYIYFSNWSHSLLLALTEYDVAHMRNPTDYSTWTSPGIIGPTLASCYGQMRPKISFFFAMYIKKKKWNLHACMDSGVNVCHMWLPVKMYSKMT